MARVSEITVKEIAEFRFLAIRKTIHFMEEFEAFTDKSFGEIQQYLNTVGVLVSDGPLVCFHNMDLERLDVEVGFPVARCLEGSGEITFKVVGAQKVVTAIDLGAYEKQDATLESLFSFIGANDYRALGDIYYQYLNETNRPAEEYLTKMFVPVE